MISSELEKGKKITDHNKQTPKLPKQYPREKKTEKPQEKQILLPFSF